MMNLKSLKISAHFTNDRTNRQAQIEAVINGNWGQVIKEEWYKDAYRCLTDMGLIFIVSADRTTIMTYYLAKGKIVSAMLKGKIPKSLNKRIADNANKYMNLYGGSIRNAKYIERKMG